MIDEEIKKILAAVITLDGNDTSFYYRFDFKTSIEDIFEIKKILATNYDIKTRFLEDKIYQMEF